MHDMLHQHESARKGDEPSGGWQRLAIAELCCVPSVCTRLTALFSSAGTVDGSKTNTVLASGKV